MADPSSDDDTDAPEQARPARRRLDNRTIGICVCIALLAALLAALAVSIVDDGGSSAKGTDDSTPTLPLKAVDPKAPTAPPAGTIEGLGGASFKLTDLVGKPVVVNFFSTTCAPCVKEMPDIEKLHQELGDKVAFVGIDVQDTKPKGLGLVKSTGVTYRTGYDPEGDVLRDFDGQALPTTVIIGADGKVVDARSGALTTDSLRGILNDHGLLAPTPTTTTPTTTTPAATTTAPP